MPSGAGKAPDPHATLIPVKGVPKFSPASELGPGRRDCRAPLQEVFGARLSGAAERADLLGAGPPRA
eukprot:10118100-Lingulodinium_polyedra.AAC.1